MRLEARVIFFACAWQRLHAQECDSSTGMCMPSTAASSKSLLQLGASDIDNLLRPLAATQAAATEAAETVLKPLKKQLEESALPIAPSFEQISSSGSKSHHA